MKESISMAMTKPMKELFDSLIRLFHEREVVEKLINANGNWKVYKKEKENLKHEIETFQTIAYGRIEYEEVIINDDQYQIHPKDALQIVVICLMAGIEDYALLPNEDALVVALQQVEGEWAEKAQRIARFLSCEEDGEAKLLSDLRTRKFLKKFFG